MARSCKGLKLPVNSDKIRTNYVRAVSQTGDGGGGGASIYVYIHTYEYVALGGSICIYAVPPSDKTCK